MGNRKVVRKVADPAEAAPGHPARCGLCRSRERVARDLIGAATALLRDQLAAALSELANREETIAELSDRSRRQKATIQALRRVGVELLSEHVGNERAGELYDARLLELQTRGDGRPTR